MVKDETTRDNRNGVTFTTAKSKKANKYYHKHAEDYLEPDNENDQQNLTSNETNDKGQEELNGNESQEDTGFNGNNFDIHFKSHCYNYNIQC